MSRRPPNFDLLVTAYPQNGAAVRCHPKTAVNTSGIPISWEDRREVETAPNQMNLLECLLMALRVVWMVNGRPLQSPKLTSTANIVFIIASFVYSVTAHCLPVRLSVGGSSFHCGHRFGGPQKHFRAPQRQGDLMALQDASGSPYVTILRLTGSSGTCGPRGRALRSSDLAWANRDARRAV